MKNTPRPSRTAPQSQYEALKAVGFIQLVDKVVVSTTVLTWLVVLGWNYTCRSGILLLEPFNLTTYLQVTILAWVAWVAVLVFRCTYFVLQLTASVKLMPYEAAQILEAYRTAGQPVQVPSPGEARA